MSDSREGSRTKGRITLAVGAVLLVVLVAVLACGGGSATHPTATPSPTTTARPTPFPSGSPSTGTQAATTFDMSNTTALTTVYGRGSGDFLSDIPALAAGDFNADGFADFVVGARFADGPADDRKDAGEAYVIFGSANPPGSVDIAAAEQGLTIYGGTPGGDLGFSAAAGDVNGDGIDDILVG
ncbi:MAG TPA: FG-GAP repeat protein, partial [Dehalococcoidia bacterium]|nr:FG-GAP repeat protein [Dehalococcoidia bacterium]